jgi:GntR family transcriptional regulator, transcriptional repressor for pyruvate dehydrogenase complex
MRSQAPLSAVKKIQGLILSGAFAEAQRLPSERQLSETLGISRASLREALTVLATLGLVRIEPGRGTFVTLSGATEAPPEEHWRFSKQYTLHEVYQFRFVTEGYAARRAALAATDATVDALREILAHYKDAARRLDLVTSAQRDFDLHHALLRMGQNRIFEDAHSSFRSVMLESQRLPAARHDRLWEASVEHERVVEAVAMRDPDGASYYMRLHITRAADRAGIVLVEKP